MKPFYVAFGVSLVEVKRLSKYIKRMKKLGAYMEVVEYKVGKYEVSLFCPKVHTDMLGNTAIKPIEAHRPI